MQLSVKVAQQLLAIAERLKKKKKPTELEALKVSEARGLHSELVCFGLGLGTFPASQK